MRNSFYKIILGLLIIILALQGKFIFDITKNTDVPPKENSINPNAGTEKVPPVCGTSVNNLMELLYTRSNDFTVNNISLDNSNKTAEVEIRFLGSLKVLEKVMDELSKDSAFREVRQYVELENEPRRLYLVYNLK